MFRSRARDNDDGASREADALIGREITLKKGVFVLESLIAEGGFGYVFRGRCADGSHCAVKRMVVTDEIKSSVEREMRILAHSRASRHIINLIDCGFLPLRAGVHEAIIATELCPGGHVLKLMQDREAHHQRFKESEVLRILSDVTLGVCYLHTMNPPIIHRDLKAENVLLVRGGGFKLCDMGSAMVGEMHVDGDTRYRVEDDIAKNTTMRYRSPEMVDLYSGKTIGRKSDVWALGCLLYLLCYFDMPFEESSLAIINGKYRIPETNTFSQGILDLLRVTLQVDSDLRVNAFHVAQRIFQLRGKPCPVKASEPEPVSEAQKPKKKFSSPPPRRANAPTQQQQQQQQQQQRTPQHHQQPQPKPQAPVEPAQARRARPHAHHAHPPSLASPTSTTTPLPTTVASSSFPIDPFAPPPSATSTRTTTTADPFDTDPWGTPAASTTASSLFGGVTASATGSSPFDDMPSFDTVAASATAEDLVDVSDPSVSHPCTDDAFPLGTPARAHSPVFDNPDEDDDDMCSNSSYDSDGDCHQNAEDIERQFYNALALDGSAPSADPTDALPSHHHHHHHRHHGKHHSSSHASGLPATNTAVLTRASRRLSALVFDADDPEHGAGAGDPFQAMGDFGRDDAPPALEEADEDEKNTADAALGSGDSAALAACDASPFESDWDFNQDHQ